MTDTQKISIANLEKKIERQKYHTRYCVRGADAHFVLFFLIFIIHCPERAFALFHFDLLSADSIVILFACGGLAMTTAKHIRGHMIDVPFHVSIFKYNIQMARMRCMECLNTIASGTLALITIKMADNVFSLSEMPEYLDFVFKCNMFVCDR